MKFGVSYNRKVKAGKAYEMLEVGLWIEHDSALNSPDQVFKEIKKKVTQWVEQEQERLLAACGERPEPEKEE